MDKLCFSNVGIRGGVTGLTCEGKLFISPSALAPVDAPVKCSAVFEELHD